MHRAKKHIGIRIFFLALFLSYFTDITFFTHSHIINGVTIVHSHFFCETSSASKPEQPQSHSHSANALTLISHVTSWTAVLLQTPEVPSVSLISTITYSTGNIPPIPQAEPEILYLRGPPTHYTQNSFMEI